MKVANPELCISASTDQLGTMTRAVTCMLGPDDPFCTRVKDAFVESINSEHQTSYLEVSQAGKNIIYLALKDMADGPESFDEANARFVLNNVLDIQAHDLAHFTSA